MMKFLAAGRLQISELTPSFTHERLLQAKEETTGLHALISIHSTKSGPAAGGCRMFDYATLEDAIFDVERLSRGMTYKNTAAELPLGGGKAVIIGNPKKIKTPELMRAFGEFVDVLCGQYFTAEDVGISPSDLAFSAQVTDFVAGLDGGEFASGDPSPHTAQGVFNCMKVARAHKVPQHSQGSNASQVLHHCLLATLHLVAFAFHDSAICVWRPALMLHVLLH